MLDLIRMACSAVIFELHYVQGCIDESELWEFLVDSGDYCEGCLQKRCRFKKLKVEVWPKVLVVCIKRGVSSIGTKDE